MLLWLHDYYWGCSLQWCWICWNNDINNQHKAYSSYVFALFSLLVFKSHISYRIEAMYTCLTVWIVVYELFSTTCIVLSFSISVILPWYDHTLFLTRPPSYCQMWLLDCNMCTVSSAAHLLCKVHAKNNTQSKCNTDLTMHNVQILDCNSIIHYLGDTHTHSVHILSTPYELGPRNAARS